jgi:adenosine kinase
MLRKEFCMKVVVCGSLAYDRIMDFPGYFSEHILPEKVHVLNVCFQVDSIKVKFGGTAGNIAYALTLMGQKPIISSTIGHDHQSYFQWFADNGIATDQIRIVEEEFTASAYITTDRADNQITGFHPGAMKHSSLLDFSKFDAKDTLVIISPGNLDDMMNYPGSCKERGIDYIFDPGQSLPMLDAQKIIQAIEGCRILTCNDYEFELIQRITGLKKEALLGLANTVIVTKGQLGSLICRGNDEIIIPVVTPAKLVDPTGAGDAYRGGLIAGLVQGKSIEHSARMGSTCASFAVECYGTQDYRFSPEEFEKRFRQCQ